MLRHTLSMLFVIGLLCQIGFDGTIAAASEDATIETLGSFQFEAEDVSRIDVFDSFMVCWEDRLSGPKPDLMLTWVTFDGNVTRRLLVPAEAAIMERDRPRSVVLDGLKYLIPIPEPRIYESPGGSYAYPASVRLSENGGRVLVQRRKGWYVLLPDGTNITKGQYIASYADANAFSPEGGFVVVGDQLWTAEGERLRKFRGHVGALHFLSDRFAIQDYQGTISLIAIPSGELVEIQDTPDSWQSSKERKNSVGIFCDRAHGTCVIADSHYVDVLNYESGRIVASMEFPERISYAKFSADGNSVLVMDVSSKLWLLDTSDRGTSVARDKTSWLPFLEHEAILHFDSTTLVTWDISLADMPPPPPLSSRHEFPPPASHSLDQSDTSFSLIVGGTEVLQLRSWVKRVVFRSFPRRLSYPSFGPVSGVTSAPPEHVEYALPAASDFARYPGSSRDLVLPRERFFGIDSLGAWTRPALKCGAVIRVFAITPDGELGEMIATLSEESRPLPGRKLEFVRYDLSVGRFELIKVTPN